MFKTASVNEALNSTKSNGVIIDVRTASEWEETGIADVEGILTNTVVSTPDMELNPNFVKDLQASVGKEKSLYFICRSGQRSQVACALAMQNGYESVYNVDGGMSAWVAELLDVKAK